LVLEPKTRFSINIPNYNVASTCSGS